MEVVYYRTKAGQAPAKRYLSQWNKKPKDDEETLNKKVKKFAKIDGMIKLAAERKGMLGSKLSAHLRGYSFQELRISGVLEGEELVRVLYFCYKGNQLVLLNAYDKPDFYEGAQKKKIEKEIEKIHKKTQTYYDDFIKNSNNYEKYEQKIK